MRRIFVVLEGGELVKGELSIRVLLQKKIFNLFI
jgi:hypothetical protein